MKRRVTPESEQPPADRREPGFRPFQMRACAHAQASARSAPNAGGEGTEPYWVREAEGATPAAAMAAGGRPESGAEAGVPEA